MQWKTLALPQCLMYGMTAFDRTDTGSELNLASPSKAASLARSGVYLTQGYDALILADRFRSHTLCSLAIPISLGQAMRTLFEKFRDMGGLTCDILLSRDLSDHTDVHEYVEDLVEISNDHGYDFKGVGGLTDLDR